MVSELASFKLSVSKFVTVMFIQKTYFGLQRFLKIFYLYLNREG